MPGLIRVVIGLLLCIGAAGSADKRETNVWQAIAIVMVGVSITLWGRMLPFARPPAAADCQRSGARGASLPKGGRRNPMG